MSPNPHAFLGVKILKRALKNFLLKIFFSFLEKEFYKSFQRARGVFKIVRFIPYSLCVPSVYHLLTIFSLSTIRVRRKKFLFSFLCLTHTIFSMHAICVPSFDHLFSEYHPSKTQKFFIFIFMSYSYHILYACHLCTIF